ncbi:putative GNAT family acetyltransferase [Crossiella equi]|uniref:GNAT family acetyltransferase n=1 Tax=Crossiella equi TaxID=130796 RepID=A0ABS5ABA8_9PSEU|nr:GNAT family N-acetyltransferase [Crossiella equi]MBP2473861.1 putative GNAT family acetyltransferase [Crossiella equi]
MDAQVHNDPKLFWAVAGPHFLADPVHHTLAITVMRRCLAGEEAGYRDPLMLTVHDNSGALVGAALRTPPHPLLVSGLPTAAVPAAVDALRLHDPGLSGVTGPRDSVEAVTTAWIAATGHLAHEHPPARAYRLERLVPPDVSGRGRLAGEADLELLVKWRTVFMLEAMAGTDSDERAAVLASLNGSGGAHVLWEVDGEAVAMAFTSEPEAGMSRVAYVYTPVVQRGRGYGSAAAAWVSQWALDRGATDVVLFADLGNDVATRIYQRLGYQPREELVQVDFSAGAGDGAVPHMRGEHE